MTYNIINAFIAIFALVKEWPVDHRPGALVGCAVVNRTWDSLQISCSLSTEDAMEREARTINEINYHNGSHTFCNYTQKARFLFLTSCWRKKSTNLWPSGAAPWKLECRTGFFLFASEICLLISLKLDCILRGKSGSGTKFDNFLFRIGPGSRI